MKATILIFSLTLAYCGMLGFCLAMEKHWQQVVGDLLPASWRRFGKPAGAVLLLLAVLTASAAWPFGMALAGWCGMLSVSGLSLALLLAWQPRTVLMLPVGGLFTSILALI